MKSTDVSYDKHKRVIKDNNPNLTKVGRFIRKFKIDELPQLFNVLKGDMCIIGRGPCCPYSIPITRIGKSLNSKCARA